jgi:type IV secretory pathway VirB4 component
VPGEFIACLEWQRTAERPDAARHPDARRHFFNKRVSIINYVSPETRPEEMLVDDSASATVRQLGDALTEMEVNGHFFGSCSLTLVLHGTDARALEHQAAEAMKVLAVTTAAFFEETYNLLNAWLASCPATAPTTSAGWRCSRRTSPT